MSRTHSEQMSDGDRLLPVFLKARGRRVLVVGGGAVAAAKVAMLATAGARITVVAPAVAPAIRAAGVTVRERPVRASDLDGVWFVVSAAPPDVNRRVAAAAARRRVFVNAVDDPAQASAYLGGTLHRGGVTIAVSTDGRAPALAGLLREAIDWFLPRDLSSWLARSEALRASWKRRGVPMAARRPALAHALIALYGDRRRTRRSVTAR